MRSRTKNNLDNETIKKLFLNGGITDVTDISPLGAGEYNAVFAVSTSDSKYVLKVAPKPSVEVLPYEIGMIDAEVYWYKRMRDETSINVPNVVFFDKSREFIDSDYFIMDFIDGDHLDKMEMSFSEKQELNANIAKMAAEIHQIKNHQFGYMQQQLYDDWYQAIRSMTQSLVDSCKKKRHQSPKGEKLLKYIDEHKDILTKVECRMVNYDIWFPNIIAKRIDGKIKCWWIDPERSFWGDRIADFVCLDFSHPQLRVKKEMIAAYNSVASEPIEINRDTKIRYGIMMAFMGLLMEAEKYYRYSIFHRGWWRNILAGKQLFYKIGFGILKSNQEK